SLIFGGGLLFSLVYVFYNIQFSSFNDEINQSIYSQYFYISLIASILAFLLIYFWERHRVHLKYIEHVFSLEELKVRVFKSRTGKIGYRLLVSSLMTTLLPLVIVMLYLFLSVTQIRELDIDYDNPKQVEILFGTESNFFDDADNFSYEQLVKYGFVIYFNAWNSMFMFIGIFTGIFIAFIYLLLFVRWMTADIVRPVNELLAHMERTGQEHVNEFAIVRTNDEIGVLGEGYNFMTRRINQYIQNISKLNETYFRFVPEQFLKILGKSSIEEISHGDQIEKEMTVLFTDIRSFTEISEEMTPKENFDFINMYLAYMEPVIGRNNGFIDKFMGDSIMALFPYEVEDAINAAIEMRIKLAEFNQVITQFGRKSINSGIGIHTGSLMLGIVGGENRLDGTVISDAVNLASRLEGLTKIYGGSVIISEDTLTKIKGSENYDYRFLDVVMVKGKKKAVYIFEILNGEDERCRELKKASKYEFGKAADMYQNKEFNMALDLFKKIYDQNPSDKAAVFYIERCKNYLKEGIPEDWDGIERLSKI
ncbi:MAG TPA: adenylate/guanylate cyclase domain-containing protein, partial [Bacteroidales bacterium]|nr:adenylate/guanylate cyclase domain-containing protein [Bacteroidales bacterium]